MRMRKGTSCSTEIAQPTRGVDPMRVRSCTTISVLAQPRPITGLHRVFAGDMVAMQGTRVLSDAPKKHEAFNPNVGLIWMGKVS